MLIKINIKISRTKIKNKMDRTMLQRNHNQKRIYFMKFKMFQIKKYHKMVKFFI